MKIKLYEFGPTRSIRVRWTLQELGVDFEPIRINLLAGEHQRPEFLKINPAGKIPVLVDGDLVLTESVAIVLYLADKYSHKGLIPSGSRATNMSPCAFRKTMLYAPSKRWASAARSSTMLGFLSPESSRQIECIRISVSVSRAR